MATETPTPEAPAAEPEKKGSKFPTAFTVLFFVLVVVWALSFIVRPGSYDYVDCGDGAVPVPGSYHEVDVDATLYDKLYDLWMAPVNGLYGIQGPQEEIGEAEVATPGQIAAACGLLGEGETAESFSGDLPEEVVVYGQKQPIGPYEEGELIGAVQVFFFVLAIGAFITVTMSTGALDAGIASLAAPLPEPIRTLHHHPDGRVLPRRHDVRHGRGDAGLLRIDRADHGRAGLRPNSRCHLIMLGAGVGTLASTVNPFATGVASDGAGIDLGNGIVLAVLHVRRPHGRRRSCTCCGTPTRSRTTRASRSRSRWTETSTVAQEGDEEPPTMTGRQKVVIWMFMVTFVLMIVSVIPWGQFRVPPGQGLRESSRRWYFPELAALFLVGAIVIGLIGDSARRAWSTGSSRAWATSWVRRFIIAMARGVTVIMNNASITDTVLNSLEGVVSGLSGGVFAVVMFIVNIPLAFLVPSSSGHATLAMPIMAPLADFAGVSRAIVVTAYQSASGWVNLFTPTSAIVMGGLTLAKVGYDRYLRFVLPLLVILFLLVCVFLFIGSGLTLAGT